MFNKDFFPEAPGIYMIVSPSKRVYIGQSTNIRSRVNRYSKMSCKDQPMLYNSFIKHGFESHTISVIELCQVGDDLNNLERLYISKYDSTNKDTGLNLTTGGQDYFFHSQEVRAKMSEAQKGNKKTLGRKQSTEEVEKRVSKLRGQKRSDKAKLNMRMGQLGKKRTLEHRQNTSRGLKGVNAKKVLNTVTGQIYSSCGEAADAIKMRKGTLIAKLNGQLNNNTILKYL